MSIMPLLLADAAILCLACIRSPLTGSLEADRWGPLQPGVDSICRVQPNDRYSSHSPANKEAPSRIVTASHAEHCAQVTNRRRPLPGKMLRYWRFGDKVKGAHGG